MGEGNVEEKWGKMGKSGGQWGAFGKVAGYGWHLVRAFGQSTINCESTPLHEGGGGA